MLWQSTLSMAMVDALVLGISMLTLVSLFRHRKILASTGSMLGLICMAAGITLFGLYYGTDFILVAVLPQLVPATEAARLIEQFHPDAVWVTGSYGLMLIVWGFMIVSRHAAKQIEDRDKSNVALQLELEARAEAEAELKEAQHQLQLKVDSLKMTSDAYERRGIAISKVNEELKIARDLAEEANQCKSEFLALMSHELRTPLNAVIGFSEMIKEETFGPVGSIKYREYATDIHSSGRHLLLVIDDILDLSKVEAGAAELVEQTLLAGELAQSAVRLVQGRAARGDVTIELDIADNRLVLMGDERKFKQILINLLSNSVKYTNPGGRCTLSVRGDRQAGLEFRIADTGIGIASEDIPQVMSQFGQVQNRLNRKLPGSGLGLPLTKSLIEMHGGTLSIESKVGVGTTVSVWMPPERVLDQDSPVESLKIGQDAPFLDLRPRRRGLNGADDGAPLGA
ncbi:MAG: ATP-binding protein [Alphaproteobacteria bacterium]|nr:ATP-binding protein [Alphaproteobacteria bacterium]